MLDLQIQGAENCSNPTFIAQGAGKIAPAHPILKFKRRLDSPPKTPRFQNVSLKKHIPVCFPFSHLTNKKIQSFDNFYKSFLF